MRLVRHQVVLEQRFHLPLYYLLLLLQVLL
jgi:hypothetical protein